MKRVIERFEVVLFSALVSDVLLGTDDPDLGRTAESRKICSSQISWRVLTNAATEVP